MKILGRKKNKSRKSWVPIILFGGKKDEEPKSAPKDVLEKFQEKGGLAKQLYELFENHPNRGLFSTTMSYWRAMYRGYQYVKLNVKENRVQEMERDEKGARRSVRNFIKTLVWSATNKMFDPPPAAIGFPFGEDSEDLNAARFATDVADYIFNNLNRGILPAARLAMNYALVYGTGYVIPYWNPDITVPIVVKERGKEKIEYTFSGDYDWDVLDPFQVFCGPKNARFFKDLKYQLIVKEISLDDAKAMVPDYEEIIGMVKENSLSDIPLTRDFYDRERLEKEARQVREKTALLFLYFERPSRGFPNGRKIVSINNNIIVSDGENPYASFGYELSLPAIPFFWNRTADRFDGESAVFDLIPTQKDINDFETMINDYSRDLIPLRLFPQGSNLKKTGQIPRAYEFNAASGVPPLQLTTPALPPHFADHQMNCITNMGEFIGMKESMQGGIPYRGTGMSALALNTLIEKASMQTANNSEDLTISLSNLTWFVLQLIKKYYTEERLVNFVGRGGAHKMRAFCNKGLDGQYTIQIKIASAIERQPARQAEAMEKMWTDGIFPALYGSDPAVKKAAKIFMRSIEFGKGVMVTDLDDAQYARAERALEEIVKKGKASDIRQNVDDPEIHLDVFKRYALTMAFDDLPEELQTAITKRIDILTGLTQQGGGQQPVEEGGQVPPPEPPGPQTLGEGANIPPSPMEPGQELQQGV